jgi:hypothetical protein
LRRLAAPRPVGPAPMTSTSTELWHGELELQERGAVRVHFFLGGSHLSLQEFLKTRNSLQCLAGEVQHVLGARISKQHGMSSGGAVRRPGGVVENYSTPIEQACQAMLRGSSCRRHDWELGPPTRLAACSGIGRKGAPRRRGRNHWFIGSLATATVHRCSRTVIHLIHRGRSPHGRACVRLNEAKRSLTAPSIWGSRNTTLRSIAVRR